MLHYVGKHPGFWHWSDTGVGGSANNLAPGVTAAEGLLLVLVPIVLFQSVCTGPRADPDLRGFRWKCVQSVPWVDSGVGLLAVLIITCARAHRVVCVCTGHPADRCRRRSAKPGP